MSSTDQTAATTSAASAPVGKLASISLDCPDPAVLADFYATLLGLQRVYERPDGNVIALTDGVSFVTMMRIDNHVAPTWPEPGQQQQMHLDIAVSDLPGAVTRALALGAREADHQPSPGAWRVLIDPAGHPFCFTTVVPE
jgi:catechol 2,3-dioxygenase-like lactoylglutathione lyase family enzyme